MEDEFRSHAAKTPVVQQKVPLYLLPDSSRVNRLQLGWVLSLSILWALGRHLTDITDAQRMCTDDSLSTLNH